MPHARQVQGLSKRPGGDRRGTNALSRHGNSLISRSLVKKLCRRWSHAADPRHGFMDGGASTISTAPLGLFWGCPSAVRLTRGIERCLHSTPNPSSS